MNIHKSSDQELMVLLKAKDHAAFTEIYNRYWAILFRHARRMLHDEDEAADVVQEIFTQIWKKSADIQITTTLSSYLYTTVRNKTIDMINRGRLAKNYLASLDSFIDHGQYVTDDQVRYNEFAALIDQEISKLPQNIRETFQLSRKTNLSYKEIATEMNISDDSVKKRISKALKILRVKFGASIIILVNIFP
ncbi:RNA polymerase sigma factor [Pedobacter sp. MC2016-24]|uniref:RNA polymerase sigma factor n=1 Tax=Pedobacter sp. MC2016-24 TaxID=2780090 RepID=UPI00188191B7|nr:RNA polymerase sigma-70 factor [Pedobacter sp. MC2016-24]MBE9599843.1 RNA polymerase sigma-70 factor [Pedobacter sp. MC2016-24]